ncbi:MAG: hypothetical protein HYY16_14190 [Planctomycetes bacterium]|nr:hypothetical protein [Planctomycetota bacterium]
MLRLTLFVGIAVLVTSCSKQPPPPSRNAGATSGDPSIARAVVLKVEGMQRGEGGKT